MSVRRLLAAGLLLSALGAVSVWADAPPQFQDVEESLTCQCGCGLTVHSCNHLQCPSALPLRVEIREQISAGQNKDGVLAYFSAKYGEKILSSPTASGFNLAAWIMPFALVAVGGLFVVFTIRRWTVRRPSIAVAASAAPAARSAGPSAHQQILDRELKEFDR